jgi:hydroxysqualene dehydroxylase
MTTTPSSPPKVAIVGAGWAGMAAAVELASAGVAVTVYEAARTAGGRARRVEINGLALDNGLHILVGAYRETLRLIELVRAPGSPPGLLRMPLTLSVEPGFRLRAPRLPAPLNLAIALLWARGLSLRDRIAAIRFMQAQRAGRFRCPSDLTVQRLLLQHRQPEHLSRLLWIPLCISALNTVPEEASAAHFLAVLRDTFTGACESSDLLLPLQDFSALFPEPAMAFVEARGGRVHIGDPVRKVHPIPGGIAVDASDTAHYSHAIIAVGPHQLAHVAGGIEALKPAVDCVAALRYRPIHSVFLQYPAQVTLPAPMTGFSRGITQWVFDRGRLAGQHGLLGVVISASGDHQELAQAVLAERVHEELRARFPLPSPLWHRVIAEKRATFACTPALARPDNSTPVPGLYLAGDYTASEYPATLETAIRSGVRCARLILAKHD